VLLLALLLSAPVVHPVIRPLGRAPGKQIVYRSAHPASDALMLADVSGQAATHGEFDGFICTCSDEGRERAAALMAEVRRRLPRAESVTDATFVSRVVESLNWQFDARITCIANDQWSQVTAEAWDGSFTTIIDCDQVEDGIAATWKAFADHHGEA